MQKNPKYKKNQTFQKNAIGKKNQTCKTNHMCQKNPIMPQKCEKRKTWQRITTCKIKHEQNPTCQIPNMVKNPKCKNKLQKYINMPKNATFSK